MSTPVLTTETENTAQRTARSLLGSGQSIIAVLSYNRVGMIAAWAFVAIVLISFLAPIVVPEPPPDMSQVYEAPSFAHPLGTDFQGADVLGQVLRGGETVLIVGAAAAAIVTLIAVTFGALAAYAGGWVDTVIT